jgi:4-amino-4-deoxy-L-arabinose transferase-like glycosyltransferase
MRPSDSLVLPAKPTRAETLRQGFIVWSVAALTLLLHALVLGRYHIFRNELYFIVCGRHPAFGYMDQPPLVPLLAAATQLFGIKVWLLRLPALIAAVAIVPLSAEFARLLGGRTVSVTMAAVAAAIPPGLAGLTGTLTTSTFEPLAWTACAYFVARAVTRAEPQAWMWAGAIAGISMEAKYGIVMWLLGLFVGLLLTASRRALAQRHCWFGVAIAAAIAAPSVIWQAVHAWPFLVVILHHHIARTNFTGSPLVFERGQILAMNVLLAPLWIAGVVAPFLIPELKPIRFLSIAFVAATAINLAAGGKDYYLFAVYPTMFAVGAAGLSRLRSWVVALWMIAATANFAVAAPLALPILNPPSLARYLARMHFKPRPDEAAAVGAPITQVFSDEMGWRALEKQVAGIYHSLPTSDQKKAAILATNYGEAAAIDVYGKADGLPPAISGQNQYYLWGPRGHDGSVIIHVNGDPNLWRRFCQSVEIAGTFGDPFAMPYENDRPIFVCRGLRFSLVKAWPHFKRYF